MIRFIASDIDGTLVPDGGTNMNPELFELIHQSVIFTYVPVLSLLSGGWGIILITIVVSAIAAWLFPMKEEKGEVS